MIRDNQPAAVLMQVARHEALLYELADLRLEALACGRLAALPQASVISHADMSTRFAAAWVKMGKMTATAKQRGKNE